MNAGPDASPSAAGRARRPWQGFFYPAALFVLNLLICGRLLKVEYLDQMLSIEGSFLALERYIQQHHPLYDWFPFWYTGMPFPNTYQSLLHRTVAAVSSLFHSSIPSAYHATTAITYSLGAVTLYFLARCLSGNARVALVSGLFFSLFSPSVLLLPSVRHDVGLWNARRLQALVVYGEGPNCTGLMLAMLALALLHVALTRRTALSAFAAAVAIASVPATNWPSTVALTMGLACYVISLDRAAIRSQWKWLLAIGTMTAGLALPLALPSTIRTTFSNANVMMDGPTPGASRWIGTALLFVVIALLRFAAAKMNWALPARFAVLCSVTLGWAPFLAEWFGIRILPNAMRFHIAFEIGLALAAGLAAEQLWTHRPAWRIPLAAILALVCGFQYVHYRRFAHTIIKSIDVTKTVEFQEARWFEQNMHGERVYASGTISFWMNLFTSTPQMIGVFDQSVSNRANQIAAYIVPAGYRSNEESAEYSLLWMKAYAVHAVSVGGPKSREYYKGFQFPERFEGRLPLGWQDGDDRIYMVPERAEGAARVVRRGDLVVHPPENGIDAGELRPFVASLDDASLPVVTMAWDGENRARIEGTLDPDHVIALAMNYDPGWFATANGRPIEVHKDGLGFMALEPHCAGACDVRMAWNPGLEVPIVLSIAGLTLASAVAWMWLERSRKSAVWKGRALLDPRF